MALPKHRHQNEQRQPKLPLIYKLIESVLITQQQLPLYELVAFP
jgi:hypothetical protein